MRFSDKRIKKYIDSGESAVTQTERVRRERHFEETVCRSLEAYYAGEAEGELSGWEFLYQQGRYISKYLWLLQGIVLFLLWYILKVLGSGYYTQRCMGIGASLFAVLLLPELWKNWNANAIEVEAAARFSLRQIYSARILLCALADMVMLCVFFLTVVFSGSVVWEEVAVQFFLPYMVNCCICFRTLYSQRGGSEAGAALSCMVWAFIWLEFVLKDEIYEAVSGPVWLAMLAVTAFYLGYCIYKGQRKCGTMSGQGAPEELRKWH